MQKKILVMSICAAGACVLAGMVANPEAAPAQDRAMHKFGLAEPLDKREGTVRLATYNMLNFFDSVDDPTLQGEFDDAGMITDEKRCQKLADAIRAMDADILALQEIESLQAIEWFRDTYLTDMGYDHVASIDVGYKRGVENSVLSRFPITNTKVWLDESLDDVQRIGPGWDEVPEDSQQGLEFRRSPLMVDVAIRDDYTLTVFCVHHKSGGLRTMWWREAEALQIMEYINDIEEQDPARNIVVMGDFNSAPWDKSIRVYTQAGMVDTLSHRIIPRWKDADPTEPDLYKTHESGRTLDYILMNSAAHRELVIGSPHVYGTLSPPDSYNWRKDPHPEGYASDHYPVIVDIRPEDRL
ncbi:MAG: endonuclease/exonuclease/phosphatase family protein [Planctomycetota bacterium]